MWLLALSLLTADSAQQFKVPLTPSESLFVQSEGTGEPVLVADGQCRPLGGADDVAHGVTPHQRARGKRSKCVYRRWGRAQTIAAVARDPVLVAVALRGQALVAAVPQARVLAAVPQARVLAEERQGRALAEGWQGSTSPRRDPR